MSGKETETGRCEVPPIGWYCTRDAGHDGPCAAIEDDGTRPGSLFQDLSPLWAEGVTDEMVERAWLAYWAHIDSRRPAPEIQERGSAAMRAALIVAGCRRQPEPREDETP